MRPPKGGLMWFLLMTATMQIGVRILGIQKK